MAEEKRRQIPIEDGNAERKKEAEIRQREDAAEAEAKTAAHEAVSEADAETSKAESANEAAKTEADADAESVKSGSDEPENESGEAAEGDKAEAGKDGSESGSEGDAEGKSEEQAAEQESERYMRLMAEFQNFKRRAAKEKTDIHAYANERIIGELLPVLDNFERALATDGADAEAYAKGMALIFEQLKTALEHAGLKEIAAMGEEFDPNFHNAVMTEASEEHEDGQISKVLQKGYTLNDKVIRPSMVAVVRK